MSEIIKEFAQLKTPAGPTVSLAKVEFLPDPSSTPPNLPLSFDFAQDRQRGGEGEGELKIGIASGIHGDELNGTYVCALLVQLLKELLYEKRVARLYANIKILPALNPSGLNNSIRFWPFDQTDINRMFPGYDKGETSQRLAAAIFSELSGATHLVDIHSSNLFVRETPQVRLYRWDEEILSLAYEFGLPILWLREITTMEKVHLPQTLSENGTKSFILQAGNALEIDAKLCKNIVFGILQWLLALHAIELQEKGDKEKFRMKEATLQERFKVILAKSSNTLSLTAESAGFFVLSEKSSSPNYSGKEVLKGEEIGVILNPVTGEIKERICSPVEGTLFTVRIHPVVYQGSLLARIVAKDELPAELLKVSHPEQPQ